MPYVFSKRALPVIFALFSFAAQVRASDSTILKSPDGNLSFLLSQRREGLYFSVFMAGQPVIQPSPLILSVNGISVTAHAVIQKMETVHHEDSYDLLGAHDQARNLYNGRTYFLSSPEAAWQVRLEVRVFNDGVAFRHLVRTELPSVTPEEKTVFNLPAKSTVWYHDLYMHYEGVHVKKQIDTVRAGDWMAPPVTCRLPKGGYASITEAALLGYPGMALQSNGKNGLRLVLANDQPTSYPYSLRYSAEDTARMRLPAVISGSFTTPWRVIITGKDLNQLVNNDIITNLNPPPDPALFPKGIHTDWIRPGRAVWKYLNGGGEGTLEVMKHFTDGAAALGFEHNILEGFWTRWSDQELKDLVDYSGKKGVGIWLWKHSKSLRTAPARDSFFSKCQRLGITGAKIDFFDSEAKEVVDTYDSILNDAAKYHILLDFHGANKPTGLMRTYPNSLVYEAVKGMEASKLADRATHETTLPFTRCLAGPAEYTVMHFGDRRKNTTWAHQIASAVILSAPLLTYAANPDSILMNPAVGIIRSIPCTWDETLVLPPSSIGELAVFARRKGDEWFLAIMNGVAPRKITIPLRFLRGRCQAAIARDGALNDGSVIMETKTCSPAGSLTLSLISGGGYIARFSTLKP